MKTSTNIPFHRHVEIGAQIHQTINFLWEVRRELNESKRNQFSRQAAQEVVHTIKRLDLMRSDLENLLCTSGVLDDDSITCNPCNVYYGPFDGASK